MYGLPLVPILLNAYVCPFLIFSSKDQNAKVEKDFSSTSPTKAVIFQVVFLSKDNLECAQILKETRSPLLPNTSFLKC